MKGTTVAHALKCAVKVKAGQKCSVTELAASLDTLAWAYRKVKKPVKRGAKKTYKTVRHPKRTYRKVRANRR